MMFCNTTQLVAASMLIRMDTGSNPRLSTFPHLNVSLITRLIYQNKITLMFNEFQQVVYSLIIYWT